MPASLGSPDSCYAYESFAALGGGELQPHAEPFRPLSLCPSSSPSLWVSVPARSKDELTLPNVPLKNIVF